MLITINTDASVNPQTKEGSYALWMVSNYGRVTKSGRFKTKVDNSTEAEVMAIVNALHLLKSQNYISVTRVIINTDCLHFHKYVYGKRERSLKMNKAFSRITQAISSAYGIKSGWLEVRHVKAHTTISNRRTYVNDWCDKEAKKALKYG